MKIKPFKNCIKEKEILNQTIVTILRSVSILCMFNFIHTFGLMGIPLRSATTTKEKSTVLLVHMTYIYKNRESLLHMFEFILVVLVCESVK